MIITLSCELVRRLDLDAVRELQIPSLLLMENAARGAAEVLHQRGPWSSVTIVCGPGNNGGDGLALARLLAAERLVSRVILLRNNKSLSADADTNYRILVNSGIPVINCDQQLSSHLTLLSSGSDLIVDAMLGTGVRGDVRSPWKEAILAINSHPATVMAIDLPSGLDGDTGRPCGCAVEADFTVTFAAMKVGLESPYAAKYCGDVTLRHIGIPADWITKWHHRICSQV